ncbi:hypothetical protein ACF065_18415 [Streptomyces sp. NPDC015232]|uniref:hypothetical protein n=1 Tax=unclassified Streptomyces TaxID=2593676 RepID=UPI0036FEA9EC
MPLTLILLALFALAFLIVNIVLCVRVWWMTELPLWRRILPTLLLCAALAASASRAWGVTAVADAVAFPLNVATAVLGMYEMSRMRARRAARHADPKASA